MEVARRSVRIHFHLAQRLLRGTGIDCRRVDRRLLARARETTRAWRSVPKRGRVRLHERMELARGRGDTGWLRIGLDRAGRPCTETTLWIRLVCGIRRVGRDPLYVDEG